MLLHDYPAWRSVGETLRELATLLARAGRGEDSPARELAGQIEQLLTDPQPDPPDYRFAFALAKPRPAATDEWEMESQLGAWLVDLTRQLADVPFLLEAPDAAAALGQALTGDLPRAWQARLAMPLQQLRQLVRGGGRGAAPPTPAGAGPAPGKCRRFVVPDGGEGYVVVLPEGDPGEAARCELACLILRDLGPDAARLHLRLLAAAPDGVSADEVCHALGLAGSRALAAERAYAALSRLRRVRLSLLTWTAPEGAVAWERRSVPLWDVAVREYGQACLDERSGALAAHGLQWSFQPRPGSWAPAPALAAEGLQLLGERKGRRNQLSLATGLLLALAPGAAEVTLPDEAVLQLLGLSTEERPRLRAAARLQRLAGWEPDFAAEGAITYRRTYSP